MESQTPSPTAQPDAAAVYAARVTALRTRETRLQQDHVRLGYVRLVFALATLVLLFRQLPVLLLPVLLVPLLGFALAARAHATVLGQLAATRRTLTFLARAQARLEGHWAEWESPQPAVYTEESLFAQDLDLFGPGSLFALLCETRTSLGRDTLAHWLLQPATPPEVRERQAAVAELCAHLPLREAFAGAPGPADAALDREALRNWLHAGTATLPRSLRWIAPVLIALTLLAAWRFAVTQSPLLLVPVLAFGGAITFRYRQALGVLFSQAAIAGRALRTVAYLAASLERSDFQAGLLRRHKAELLEGSLSASQAIARLQSLTLWAEARGNYLVRLLLDIPLLYSLQLGLALQDWRSRFAPRLLVWLDSIAATEALLSLGAYSFEHPGDSFPVVHEPAPAHFDAVGLGHPLLPEAGCVRNDVRLDASTQILLVSGSNMSGKSTLLRSVGVNTVLAFAGAPVRAHRLHLSPLTLAASIHVNDSLQAGRSRFYAEILRLRAIAQAAQQQTPVLFLVDELLAGTNSSDRLAGARGLLLMLLHHGAIGLLSTHDLALTRLGAQVHAGIRNVHLEDQIVEGELRFDYTLREGPVSRSNGLALMRLIGLDV